MALKLKKAIVDQYHLNQSKTKRYTVLLVDDEQANLKGLARALEADYNIICAENGIVALDVIKSLTTSEQIHLIISDQRMPQMTGVELFEQAILLVPDTIRMLLTGFADINAIIDAINRGAVYKFLTKPIDPRELRISVQRALESFELSQRNKNLMSELLELNASLERKVMERTCELAQKKQALEQLNTELERQIAIIEQLSITDELSQLYNRRYFNKVFVQEIQRAAFEGIMLSFLMFDVDSFKAYNDNYGHLKGDEVLKTIALTVKAQCLGTTDYVFRLGGEEFGVIFYNLNVQEAFAFADKIRVAITDLKIEHAFSHTSNYITVSCGLITVLACPNLKMDDLYKQADDALYRAKDAGKNRVIQV